MTENNKDTGGQKGGRPKRIVGTPVSSETHLARGGSGSTAPPASQEDEASAKKAKRTERLVATLFLLSILGTIGFVASYFVFEAGSVASVAKQNRAMGGTMAFAFLAVAFGAVIWVRHLMPSTEETQEREPLPSPVEEKEGFAEEFDRGVEQSGFVKRPLVRRTMLAALVPLGIAPLVLLRDLSPLPGNKLASTVWRKGMRLVIYGTGEPIRAATFNSPGSIITAIPEGYEHELQVLADATVVAIKLRPEELQLPPEKMKQTVNGIIVYSKICTHVGCPAALFEQETRRILCPCHQSTFDATNGAEVIFGPAARPLPQLPITVDNEGYLVAAGDFPVPVGPSYWDRG